MEGFSQNSPLRSSCHILVTLLSATAHPLHRDPNSHLQESSGPPGPKSPKSLKKVSPGLPARSVQKVSKRVEMPQKGVKKRLFRDLFETFRLFSRLFGRSGPGGPRRLFGDFSGISGPEGSETPVNGRSGLNPWTHPRRHQPPCQGVDSSRFRVAC